MTPRIITQENRSYSFVLIFSTEYRRKHVLLLWFWEPCSPCRNTLPEKAHFFLHVREGSEDVTIYQLLRQRCMTRPYIQVGVCLWQIMERIRHTSNTIAIRVVISASCRPLQGGSDLKGWGDYLIIFWVIAVKMVAFIVERYSNISILRLS